MTDEHRVKIANSNVLNALLEHVEGRRDMTSTQVSAGIALLKKVLPDLQSTENKTEITTQNVVALPARAETTEAWQAKVSTQH
jgi:hypothetical protein